MESDFLSFVVVYLVILVDISNAKLCPSGFLLHQSNVCYKIYHKEKTWNEAKAFCTSQHSSLISIHSESMYQYLRQFSKTNKRNVWIGANDKESEYKFKWEDGSTNIPISWWAPANPNIDHSENCVHLSKSNDGKLNDQECYYKYWFTCEMTGCPKIQHCKHGNQTCTHQENTCSLCEQNKVFFKLSNTRRKCERMCSYNSHFCWPGICKQDLAENCLCANGFNQVSISMETKCQLNADNKPSLETCATVIVGENGEQKRALSNTTSTACKYLQHSYGNYRPKYVSTDVLAEFTINITSYSYPRFIHESHFGVTDVTLLMQMKDIRGKTLHNDQQYLKRDTSKSIHASQTYSQAFNYTVPTTFLLSNGQRLCVTYEAKGGGYLKPKNFVDGKILAPDPYIKTTEVKELCYIYDVASPEHCLLNAACTNEPLDISDRATRSPHVMVTFEGWEDPLPSGAISSAASGVESYQMSVHEVLTSNIPLKRDMKSIFSKIVNNSVTTMQLNLTTDKPKLFCIILEVKDVADNVRQTRRFVLYDNSSFINVDSNKDFYVISASTKTGFLWQTHHNPVCLSWKDYFINRIYLDNPFLSPIEPEAHGLITGIYEQTTGKIPVNGTENVHGIIGYEATWSLNNGAVHNFSAVQNFTLQSHCYNFDVKDGETYTLTVKATDIMGNTKEENRTVHIDRTPPHISNIWLIKDGYRRLFVHDSIDLSEVQLYFETLDPHSGIMTIEWSFGTSDAGSELIKGNNKVNTINETCPDTESACYCPNVGDCEITSYTIPMKKLVAENKHKGDHNRNYFFTIKVTNNAMLSNIEHLDILVDDSPPEVGVVMEGPSGGKDVDYMSDESVTVHWHGFVDHESGIKLYRVALARSCLMKDELLNSSKPESAHDFREVIYTINAVTFSANFTGRMFTSVVAINNAMDVSEVVCSDGITKENKAPIFRNVTLQNGRWSDTVVCHQGIAWLMQSSLSKKQLHPTESCAFKCSNITGENDIARLLPEEENTWNKEVSEFMCQTKNDFSSEQIIYLPQDKIYLQWDLEDSLSQIEDFHVGFGVDATDNVDPSVIKYHSTNIHQSFKRQHIGIGSDEIFYIFVKARSKAGLETVIHLGPILIDETPPERKKKPDIHIDGENIFIGWDNATFNDKEQTGPIDTIYFQFGHDAVVVTPMMEWVQNISSPCDRYNGGCIKYPYKTLQKKDKEQGLKFYVKLYFYNKAGHYAVYKSDVFQVPSLYPPGKGIVLDVDPDNQGSVDPDNQGSEEGDIDVHTKANTICARWKGFRHHENMQFAFGVGTTQRSANIFAFKTVHNISSHCETSPIFSPGIVYYVSIRANCTGGITITASNGVQILPEIFLKTNLKVSYGKDCTLSHPVKEVNIIMNSTRSFSVPLKAGVRYVATLSNSAVNLTLREGIIEKYTKGRKSSNYTIVPYVDQPIMEASCESFCNVKLRLFACPSTRYIRSSSTKVISIIYGSMIPPMINYKVIVMNDEHNETRTYEAKNSTEVQMIGNITYLTLDSFNFKQGYSYSFAMQPCIIHQCIEPFVFHSCTIEKGRPVIDITTTKLTKSIGKVCYDIHAYWKTVSSSFQVSFSQWCISKDGGSQQMMTKWKTLTATDSQVNECVSLAAHLHKIMFFCVRVFTEAGTEGLSCRKIDIQTLGEYDQQTVYEFDANSDQWNTILQVLHSRSIGTTSSSLHNSELDFATSSSKIIGAIAYGSGRNISWYVMDKKQIPHSCSEAVNCFYTENNTEGYVKVPHKYLLSDKIYYICLFANATEIKRENFIENLQEIKQCSNGFIIDNSPPTPGDVKVYNRNGYITNINGLTISWKGFTDNIDATQLGYPDPIQFYSYAIGSRPGGDDVRQFTGVGHSTMAIADGLEVSDGSSVYITVSGTDHTGLSSNATSEELIVDTSPPAAGVIMIHCGYGSPVVCSSSSVTIHLAGFEDMGSGIDTFDVDVGSVCGLSNIGAGSHTSRYINLNLDDASDGHTYCINVKARNRAGLLSRSISKEFLLDVSPPDGGQVLDGSRENLSDVDYQTGITSISSHWIGFDDIQSGIDYYRVGLGLQPFDDDIEPMTNVGLRTEVTWNSTFIVGERYYTIVEACNNAGLCKTLTSNGLILDNSPPIRGIVQVGSEDGHQKYLQTRSSMHVRWFGFEDPQSDIEHFDVCVGSAPDKCDILPFFTCLLQSNIIKTGLNLTDEKNYFVTVRAHNKAGLFSTSTSDAFRVDSTPPKVVSTPTFQNVQYNTDAGHFTTWEKSVLTIVWQFEDQESPITHHVVTLKTHHDGHTSVELEKVGNVKELTLHLDQDKWLSNGDTYTAVITACNAAGHCTSSESSPLLVDSTPPHQGGFKPPLYWQNFKTNTSGIFSSVQLTWYGFHDEESELNLYYLSVSRSYSDNELSGGAIVIKANESRINGLSEQTVNITLKDTLKANDLIILTIWASNEAGLNSSIGKVSVNCLSNTGTNVDISKQGGLLELEKHSCDIHYCNKDCTCAIVGLPCVETETNTSCISLNDSVTSMDTPRVQVYGGISDNQQNITASSACLTAHWFTESPADMANIERFEWSIGLDQQPVGEGIFDLKREIPWKDVGTNNEIIHCLRNNTLIHSEDYRIYVKVWYSDILSRVFQSNTFRIDQTAPTVRKGAYVSDSDASCKKDLDFIDWMDTITGCWRNVFSERQGKLTHYTFAIGTSPGGDDIQSTIDVGLVEYKQINNASFHHGTKYHITVTAYNNVGLHRAASSDGFVIDMDTPVSGVVFNTERHHDTIYQSSTEQFAISWHGFQDHFSGIKYYSIALVDDLHRQNLNETIFRNVGIRNRYTFKDLKLLHGHTYYGVVKAYDAAGHASNISVSNGKVIDTTPPFGLYCSKIINEVDARSINITTRLNSVAGYNFSKGVPYIIRGRLSTFLRRVTLSIGSREITFPVQVMHNGSFFFEHAFVSDLSSYEDISLHDDHSDVTAELVIGPCEGVETFDEAAVRINQFGANGFIVNIVVNDEESAIYKVWLGAGTVAGGFQVRSLQPVHWRDGEVVYVDLYHGTNMYFTVIAQNHAGLHSVFRSKPMILDKTPPIVRTRPVLVATEVENTTDTQVNINVTWVVEDEETNVTSCKCALGRHLGSSDLYQFTPAAALNACFFNSINVSHGDTLYGSVHCLNEVELVVEMTSDPLIISIDNPINDLATLDIISVDKTAIIPESGTASSVVVQDNQTCIQIEWRGFSDVSGIDYFEYRLLHNKIVQTPWTTAGLQTMTAIRDLSLVSGEIYTTEVRALNSGHLPSDTISADVLVLSTTPRLSGRPMKIQRTGESLHLDWTEVFAAEKNAKCQYDVTVGSHTGYNDILDKKGFDTASLNFVLVPTMLAPDLKEIFVILTCNYVTGSFGTYRMQYPLV